MIRFLPIVLAAWIGTAGPAWTDASSGAPAAAAAEASAGPALPVENPARVITAFHDAYQRYGRPRILVHANRSLVADRGEMLPAVQVERTARVKGDEVPLPGGSVQIGSGNENAGPGPATGLGGERQESATGSVRTPISRPLGVEPLTEIEARELEEQFLRPFMEAKARLVDQRVAEIARRVFASPGANFLSAPESSAEQREIESLKKSAEVVVEVLARWREVVVPEPSGNDRLERRISLTATATNLADGVRFAQVSSDSLFGFYDRRGDRKERLYAQLADKEIVEQAALALMEQMARAE